MANVKINDLAVIADPASTDVLPIVDVTLDTTNKISIADILKTAPDGTAAAPAIAFEGDSNTGIYHPGSEQIGFATSGLGRLFIASDGNVGIGATDPSAPLSFGKSVYGEPGSEDFYRIKFNNLGGVTNDVGIGQSSGTNLDFNGQGGFRFLLGTSGEAARINSSGRLLVGTSSARTNFYNGNNTAQIQLEGTNFQNAAFAITCNANSPDKGGLIFAKSRGTAVGSNTVVQEDDDLGSIEFQGADGSQFVSGANIKAEVDGTPGANDMPSRLVFSTTADSAATPTARMTIDSDGLVGIGTTDPGAKLDIRGSAGTEVRIDLNEGTTTNPLRIEQNATEGRIQTTASQPLILAGQSGAGSTSDIRLETRDQERLRITSDGNLGIGTSAPQHLLSVVSSLSTAQTVASFGTPSASAGLQVTTDGNLTWGFNAANSRNLTFSTDQIERARIDSDGRVGIGITDPESTLHLRGSNAQVRLTPTNDTTQTARLVFTSSDRSTVSTISSGGLLGQDINFRTNADRMRITSDGKVGIGTTAPAVKLEINGSTGIPRTVGGYTFREIVGGNVRAGIYSDTDNPLIFRTGGDNEAARIDNDGRLLLGTSSASTGALGSGIEEIYSTASGETTHLLLHHNANSGTRFANLEFLKTHGGNIVLSGNTLGRLRWSGFDGSSPVTAGLIECQVDGTPGSNDMPGRLVFSTTADGASSPTERMRIKANGSILFADDDEAGITSGTVDGKSIEFGSIMRSSRASTVAAGHVAFYNPNGFVGQIFTSGSSTGYTTSSDYRLKDNVVPLANAADRVNQLQVHRFNFIADPGKTVDGFLAHEAQAVVPECATGTKDEVDDEGNPVYQGIDQSKIVPLLTAALQEALAKIETLEQRLNDAGL